MICLTHTTLWHTCYNLIKGTQFVVKINNTAVSHFLTQLKLTSKQTRCRGLTQDGRSSWLLLISLSSTKSKGKNMWKVPSVERSTCPFPISTHEVFMTHKLFFPIYFVVD
ncbi:Uncharacterized protein TCM_044358 [Theobroma cacao]|uniref:Uncharacterized protein n=1 Tax=Theobroma cacao TaxID=3641 RepID=A0A061FPS1_THECC|nr:Uncharacterized protein TCM_044358 [Theobroma cacao]